MSDGGHRDLSASSQEDIHCAGASVIGPCCGKGEHDSLNGASTEPDRKPFLQHREAFRRVEPSSVNNEEASQTEPEARKDKILYGRFCFLPCETVEIDMVLDGKFPSFQFLHELVIKPPDRSFDIFIAEGDIEVNCALDQLPEVADHLALFIRSRNGRSGPESTGPNSLSRLIEERLDP